jgi:ABC-2 type transport system permease protein
MEIGNPRTDTGVPEQREEPPADSPVSLSACHPVSLSPVRAWFYLIWLSLQRQARARQVVWWIALSLLGITTVAVAENTAQGRWGMDHWRSPRGVGPSYQLWLDGCTAATSEATAADPVSGGVGAAILGSSRVLLAQSGFVVFTRWIVYFVFVTFLLPVCSLSFATEALGSEREARSLVWLLSRPLPRSAIYLAKFVALLPWALGLNLGGFALLCLAAGSPGLMAFELFWPAVVLATLAFAALFHLMGALFRRAAIVAIVYSCFLEIILGNMPGYMKRFSISFYTRCLMFDEAERLGVQPPEKPWIYLPVDGTTAVCVLLAVTVALLAAGMAIFARLEYRDEG